MNRTILGYLVENNTFEFVKFSRISFTFFCQQPICLISQWKKKLLPLWIKLLRQHIFFHLCWISNIFMTYVRLCMCVLEEDRRRWFLEEPEECSNNSFFFFLAHFPFVFDYSWQLSLQSNFQSFHYIARYLVIFVNKIWARCMQ